MVSALRNPLAVHLAREFADMQDKTNRVFAAFDAGQVPSTADCLWLAQCIGTAMGVMSERVAALERQEERIADAPSGLKSPCTRSTSCHCYRCAPCSHHPGEDCACFCRFAGCSLRNCAIVLETP